MRFLLRTLNKRDFFTILISAIVYYLLISQWYVITQDDCEYRFFQNDPSQPLKGLRDLLSSNWYGYLHTNGRFLAHCFVQFVLSFGGIKSYFILSTISFVILWVSLVNIVRHNTTRISGDGIYLILLITILVPHISSFVYGPVAQTINYMWSATIYSLFIAVYMHIKEKKKIYSSNLTNSMIALFGFICGCWQESFALPLAGALLIYHVINLRQTKGSLLWLILGFGCGAAFLIFAPSNFSRLSGQTGLLYDPNATYEQYLSYHLRYVLSETMVCVLFGIGLLSIVIDLLRFDKIRFIPENWIWFSSALIALAFTLFTVIQGSFQGIWQLTIIAFWDIVIFLRFISYYLPNVTNNISVVFRPICIVLLLLLYGYVWYSRKDMKDAVYEFQSEMLEQKSDTIYDGKLQFSINSRMPKSSFLYDLVCPLFLHYYRATTMPYMTRFLTKGEDSWGTTILPEPIQAIKSNFIDDYQSVYYSPNVYIAVRVPNDKVNSFSGVSISSKKNGTKQRLFPKVFPPSRTDSFIPKTNLDKLVVDEEYTYYIERIKWLKYHTRLVQNADTVYNGESF